MKKGGTSTSSVRTEERRDLSFASGAARLAGLAGVLFGWSPEAFWRATPAELAALVRAVAAEEPAPADATTLARLRKAFPDG